MLPIWTDSLDLVCMSCLDDLLRLIAKSLRHFLMHPLHLGMADGCQFAVARLMSCNLCRTCTSQALLFEVCLDLLTSRTGSIEVLTCIAGDLRLPALSFFDLIALTLQAQGKLGTVDRRSKLLRPVQFARLQGPRFSILGFREIEEHDVSMQLWRGIPVYRARTVMFETRRDPLTRCFWRMGSSHARLDEPLHLV